MKKIIMLMMVALLATIMLPETANAQKDLKSVYSLISDTVTNTATIYLTSPQINPNKGLSTTVQAGQYHCKEAWTVPISKH
jgi:hypothetical protein